MFFQNFKLQQNIPRANECIDKRTIHMRFDVVKQYHLVQLNQRREYSYVMDSASNPYSFRESAVVQYNSSVPWPK